MMFTKQQISTILGKLGRIINFEIRLKPNMTEENKVEALINVTMAVINVDREGAKAWLRLQ